MATQLLTNICCSVRSIFSRDYRNTVRKHDHNNGSRNKTRYRFKSHAHTHVNNRILSRILLVYTGDPDTRRALSSSPRTPYPPHGAECLTPQSGTPLAYLYQSVSLKNSFLLYFPSSSPEAIEQGQEKRDRRYDGEGGR